MFFFFFFILIVAPLHAYVSYSGRGDAAQCWVAIVSTQHCVTVKKSPIQRQILAGASQPASEQGHKGGRRRAPQPLAAPDNAGGWGGGVGGGGGVLGA